MCALRIIPNSVLLELGMMMKMGIKKAGYKLYWIGCGTADFAWPGTEVLDKALTRNGMEHTLFASDGGHVWANWRLYLNTFARLLFK